MCKIDWNIIQGFTDSLIWPVIVIILFLIFKNQITRLVNRITNESEIIELGSLKFYLKQIERIKVQSQSGETPTINQTKQLISATVLIQIEGIKHLGNEYLLSSYDKRRIIESKIKEYCIGLTINDIQPLLSSEILGDRIALIFGLQYIYEKTGLDPNHNDDVKRFIINNLDNDNSFIRYELLQLVFSSENLKSELRSKLNLMKEKDTNSAIRNIIKLFSE